MARHDEQQLPPAPWQLHGEASFAWKLVRKELAQPLVPPDARIICVWPGLTVAVLYVAQYRDSPVGEYHEVIVAPAIIRLQGRIGFWISHILVDNERSRIAGRSIWALPKQSASMQWQAAPQTRIHVEAPLLRLQAVFATPSRSIRLPFIGTALSKRDRVANSFVVRGAARIGVTRATIELTEDAGLRELGWNGPRRMYVCSEMDLTIGAPRPSPPAHSS